MNTAMIYEVSNFNRPIKLVALDLINAANNFVIHPDKIVFGKPMTLDQRPDIPSDMNTFVPCTIDQEWDDRFVGDDGFMYRRLPFSAVVPSEDIQVVPGELPCMVSDILDQLNLKLGTQLTIKDVHNDQVQQGQIQLTLRASDENLVWFGEVDVEIVSGVPPGARLTEDGRIRVTEDGRIRVIESA